LTHNKGAQQARGEARTQPPEGGRWAEISKKIQFRWNELKIILQLKELALFRDKNELYFGTKNVNQSENYGQKSTMYRALIGAGKRKLETGNWILETRKKVCELPISGFHLPVSIFQFRFSGFELPMGLLLIRKSG
jgi:hypothetical protein